MRTIDPPELWGIGRYLVDGEPVAFPVSQTDLQVDIGSALKLVGSLGLEAGQQMLVVSTLSGAAQFWPVQVAALASGVKLSCADATRFDAFRVAMFLRHAPFDAVVGVTADVLDGLEQDLGLDLGEVLSATGVVAALPDAVSRLDAAGVATRRLVPLGPTLAWACPEGALHADDQAWTVTADPDRALRISAATDRAATVDGVPTGLTGALTDGPCGCGGPDRPIHLDPIDQT